MAQKGQNRGFTGSLAISAVLASTGCNLGEGYADFGEDLTNPEEVVIDGPGTKIADGPISGMLVDPWGDDGAVIVGFRYEEDGPHLYMQPFDGSKGCDAGLAYRCIVFARLEGQPQLIATLSQVGGNGRGTLNFVNHRCQTVYGGIEDAELPSRLFEFPPGFVVQAGNQLLDIDPYARTTRVMTDNLQFWSGAGDVGSSPYHYYVGDGQLVVFDDERTPLLSLGKGVSQVVFEQSDPSKGVFLVEEGKLVHYVSSGGTSLANATPELLAEDVCSVSVGTYGVSYFSPCAERNLVIMDLLSRTPQAIDVGVGRLLVAEKRAPAEGMVTEFEAAYTKAASDNPGFEDVWLKSVSEPTRLWQPHLAQFFSGSLGESPKLAAVVDSDGTFGRLIRVDETGETTLHERVVLGYPIEPAGDAWLAMTDLEQSQGKLTLIARDGRATVIAEKVPLSSKRVSPERDPELTGVEDQSYYGLSALMSDVGESTGSLGLMERDAPKTYAKLASGVKTTGFEFFRNMAAIGYLEHYDPKTNTGRLIVHQALLNVSSEVADNVVEFSELLWPWEGVIYTVRDGDDYSIWAARAK